MICEVEIYVAYSKAKELGSAHTPQLKFYLHPLKGGDPVELDE